MAARLIDGKALALQVREGLVAESAAVLAKTGVKPGLATILVGELWSTVIRQRQALSICLSGVTQNIVIKWQHNQADYAQLLPAPFVMRVLCIASYNTLIMQRCLNYTQKRGVRTKFVSIARLLDTR